MLGSPRELGTVGLVSGLCGAYAAVLIMTSVFLVTVADEAGGGVAAVLGVVATVFIGIAVYVGAIVIVNAVDTVLAGRLSQIALLRLLGARGRSLRGAVVRGATLTGVVGALVGTTIGTIAADVFRIVLVARGTLPDIAYPFASALLALPIVTMTPACAVAGWIGSRRILRVSPAAALSDASVTPVLPRRTSVVRAALAGLMIGGGAAPAGAGDARRRGRRDVRGVHRRVRRLGRGRHRAAWWAPGSSSRGWSGRSADCSARGRSRGWPGATPCWTRCAPPARRWAWSSASPW